MKKTIKTFVTICITLVLGLVVSTSTLNASAANTNGKGNAKKNITTVDAPLYGRFSIPSVGVDVAMYNSNTQAVCDALDAACFYYNGQEQGMTLADHNYQGFSKLHYVTVGATATITPANGGTIYLKCVEFQTGHNTGSLLDDNGNRIVKMHDLLTYVCMGDGDRIYIYEWDIIGVKDIDFSFNSNFKIDIRTLEHLSKFASESSSYVPVEPTDDQATTSLNKKNKNNGNSKKK